MKFMIIALLICINSCLVLGQVPENIQRYRNDAKGGAQYRCEGIMDGNLVRTLYYNDGEVGRWNFSPSLEWPQRSGHQYLDGYTFMIGAKVKTNSGLFITPIETNYREEVDRDPVTGEIWGVEPISGYSNSTSIAKSNDSSSWPAKWPDVLGLTEEWNGKWFGYYGAITRTDVLETFYVMDDSKDREFTRPPNNYYPISSDSTHGGLGLRIEVRGIQFKHPALEDILIWIYDVVNISDYDYDTTAFGIFVDPGVGSQLNLVRFDDTLNLIYAWSSTGIGIPGNYVTGYYGHTFLETPGNASIKLQSVSFGEISNKSPTGIWPKNDATMWSKMTGGIKDTLIGSSNFVIVSAFGPFSFKKWSRERFAIAMMCGKDLNDLKYKKTNIQMAYANNFDLSILPTHVYKNNVEIIDRFSLHQNFPNPFNPSTTFSFYLPKTSSVTLKVFDPLGREVATVVSEELTAGNYSRQWNATHIPSGVYFCRLQAGTFTETKKLVLLR